MLKIHIIILICILPILFLITGCGGGSSGGGATSEQSTGTLELTLVPVRIFREGSSESQAIYASAKGSGISGGRLMNAQGVDIPNSDLRFENASNKYQVIIESQSGSLIPGKYTLKYYIGGETKFFENPNVEWTTIPSLQSGLNIDFNPDTKYLTVFAPTLSGDIGYYLELYDANSGFFRKETSETRNPSSIIEYVAERGDYRVALVANKYEGGILKAKIIYFFRDVISTY